MHYHHMGDADVTQETYTAWDSPGLWSRDRAAASPSVGKLPNLTLRHCGAVAKNVIG